VRSHRCPFQGLGWWDFPWCFVPFLRCSPHGGLSPSFSSFCWYLISPPWFAGSLHPPRSWFQTPHQKPPLHSFFPPVYILLAHYFKDSFSCFSPPGGVSPLSFNPFDMVFLFRQTPPTPPLQRWALFLGSHFLLFS